MSQLVKRPASDAGDGSAGSLVKKVRTEGGAIIKVGPKRTSSLMAPIMKLEGHDGAIMSMRFSPTGKLLASGSADKKIFIWRVHGDCENVFALSGHKAPVLQVQWSGDGESLWSASADKTVSYWDAETGARSRRFVESRTFVNSVAVNKRGAPIAVMGCDDGAIKLLDPRERTAVATLNHMFPVTSVALAPQGDVRADMEGAVC